MKSLLVFIVCLVWLIAMAVAWGEIGVVADGESAPKRCEAAAVDGRLTGQTSTDIGSGNGESGAATVHSARDQTPLVPAKNAENLNR